MRNNLVRYLDSRKVIRNIFIAIVVCFLLTVIGSIFMVGRYYYNIKYVSDKLIKETIGEEIIHVGNTNLKIGAENIKSLDIDDKIIEESGVYRYCVVKGEIEIVNGFLKIDSPFEAIYFYNVGNEYTEKGWELNRFELLY